MENLPAKIYLQIGELTEDEVRSIDFTDLSEVTWCVNRIHSTDIEYILNGKSEP